MIVSFM